MYQAGDQVVYGIHGVCRVSGVESKIVDRKQVSYLVLEPVNQEGARYLVPSHNEIAMAKIRPMLTPEEMEDLFVSDQIRQAQWIRDENLRKQNYRELITSGDRTGLMAMVCSLYKHKKTQSALGKKVHLADENFLRDAERLLIGEISVVMGVTGEEAKNLLRTRLKSE